MFEYEQETYGSKGRERIRAAAMAHTGKKGKVLKSVVEEFVDPKGKRKTR